MEQRNYPIDEYFIIEEMSEIRYEYIDGAIIAMPGGTPQHNLIEQNLARAFDALCSGCEAFLAGMRIKTPFGSYTYPDVMLVCGALALSGDRLETVTNPLVIAEVLSEATRDYDRGQKFDICSTISTLRDYLLVDQYAVDVEHRFFQDARWQSTRYTSREDAIPLTGVEVVLPVRAIYDH